MTRNEHTSAVRQGKSVSVTRTLANPNVMLAVYQCCHGSADVLSENGHCAPNKIPKILKIFKGVEGANSQEACFSTKELDYLLLGYSDGFDLAHGLALNQSHVNNPEMNDPIS